MRQSFLQKLKDLLMVFAIFFKIGLFSFGGGYAMLLLIETEIVEKRKWLTHGELMDIFIIAESTPGAIAINVATFVGAKRGGIFGGCFATFGVVLPSFAIIVGLSYAIALVKDNVWVSYLFKGIRIGVLVMIAKAVLSFYKEMKKNLFSFILMIGTFLLALLTNVSVIYIVLGAMLLSSLAVAFASYRNNVKLHMKNTDEYFCEKHGKALKAGEYYNERLFDFDKSANSIKRKEGTRNISNIGNDDNKNTTTNYNENSEINNNDNKNTTNVLIGNQTNNNTNINNTDSNKIVCPEEDEK